MNFTRMKIGASFFLIVVVSILGGGAGIAKTYGQENKKPNILFIAVDDLRPELGAYGKKYMITPAMDQLAKEGRVFLKHYVNVPTCGASRYAILTGRYPQSPEALSNAAFEKFTGGKKAGPHPESFVELFKRNGYQTIGIGKISHSPDGQQYGYREKPSGKWELPNSWTHFLFNAGKWGTGWNAFFGYANGSNRQQYKGNAPVYEAAQVTDTAYPDGLTAQLAVDQLGQLKGASKPFLLAVGFFKPHLPFNAPKKYWDLYANASIPLSPTPDIPGMTHVHSFHNSGEINQYDTGPEGISLVHPVQDSMARIYRHAYFAAVSFVDAQIGKVLAALKANGLDKNTIIVLWGDHGWHLGDERVWGKHTLSEYALQSPLIIKFPGMPAQGKATQTIAQSIDVYPTLLQLTGIKASGNLDGRSLWPQLQNPHHKTQARAYAYFNRGITMRTDRYRLTRYYRKEVPLVELYDYQQDPHETRSVAGQQRATVKKLWPKLENGKTFIQNYWK